MNDPETQETIGKNPKQRKPEIINDAQHGEPRCSQRVNIFCFLSDAHCVTNMVNPDKSIVDE